MQSFQHITTKFSRKDFPMKVHTEYCYKQLQNYRTWAYICRKNFLDLRIYYQELNYDFLEEIPAYTPSDYGCKYLDFIKNMYVAQVHSFKFIQIVLHVFSADVGGMLGLCLGASILTLLEFLEFSIGVSTGIYRSKFLNFQVTPKM